MKYDIINWIRNYFSLTGGKYAIIGISGGKDSLVAAKLLTEALGKDYVIGVSMPHGKQADIEDVNKIFSLLDIRRIDVNIKDAFDGLTKDLRFANMEINDMVKTNLPARLRMCTLYSIAANFPDARVVNTCNKSEDFVGWATKFGDAAGDFSLLQDLTVREVIELGRELGLPEELINKTPNDGMCGASDEDKLKVSYNEIDDFLMYQHVGPRFARIMELHRRGKHKMEPMPGFVKRENKLV